MKSLSILILVLIPTICWSQSGYESGYIVTLQNDTIYGMVKDRDLGMFHQLYRKIKFKPEKGRKKRYSAYNVLAYRVGHNEFISIWIHSIRDMALVQRYTSRPGLGTKQFVKVIYRGKLNYYHWEYVDGEEDVIEWVPLFQRDKSEDMVRVTQGIFGLKKKRLAEYFRDCPTLINEIQAGNLKDPIEIIQYFERNCGSRIFGQN